MPTITYSLKSDDQTSGEPTARAFLKRVREVAEGRSIAVPKKISSGGCYGEYFYVDYRKNTLRDIIREVGAEMDLEER
jgi:hypothetical protein